MVFDSSTLILLAKIDLLRESAEDISIVIPPKVKEECLFKESLDALLIKTLIAEGKIEVEKAGHQEGVRKLRADFRIEAGEAQALWLGKRLGVPLAVDDGPTIKACKVLGVQFVTAIHFLVNLKGQGQTGASLGPRQARRSGCLWQVLKKNNRGRRPTVKGRKLNGCYKPETEG